ncbi:MAG: glutamine synthetase III [Flavobacteriales bacterium]|jgi:glutamine synthetase|nr:glutamine synthetase III [Flavobacteriales bacterium]
MAKLRFDALNHVMNRPVQDHPISTELISDYYGSSVFHDKAMQQYLPRDIYKKIRECIVTGKQLDRNVADHVASGMKAWALSKDVTHYTHWFQPLTGRTAEKHDAFFTPTAIGESIESFGGGELAQQEPDASSFPNGGLRNTFEARGYTAWDPSSPAFIISGTLCIPTVFVAYTGQALDYKAPLIKALQALNDAAVPVAQYFDRNVTRISATLGWEQEYFLVDAALYSARPDLMLTGRTLFGHSSSKGQQLDDHYFGSIPERAADFIRDFEEESLRLGIPIQTRHNEVAPNQFECAPLYEEANLAVDHNLLVMDVMEKVAHRHHFRVLLHEKPYAGINGSGKHNNWSLSTNTGVNLLGPGNTPKTNLRFLTFFITSIKAVNEYSDLLRATIASAGNDHRLGANEAPPAIISIFIGSQLTKVLEDLENRVKEKDMSADEKTELKLNIGKIPEILLDNTDRNRTSPFAFTGNKFEFRAVGSAANCSGPMTVLNTIMAKQLREFAAEVDSLIKKGRKKDEAILAVLRTYIIDSKNILFEGNGYGDEWVKEAKKRGLSNVKTTPHALGAYLEKKVVDLFEEAGVLTHEELEARNEIYLENYKLKIQIESRVAGDLALNHIIPASLEYQSKVIEGVRGLKEIYGEKDFKRLAKPHFEIISSISEHVTLLQSNVDAMIEERKIANNMEDALESSKYYCEKVIPYLETLRYEVDKLELLVDDELWPMPKYRELLFTR